MVVGFERVWGIGGGLGKWLGELTFLKSEDLRVGEEESRCGGIGLELGLLSFFGVFI